jgi:hypothetical protein
MEMVFKHFTHKNKLLLFIFIVIISFLIRVNPSREFLLDNPELILLQGENEKNATKIKLVFYHYWYGKNNRKKALNILEKSKVPKIKIFLLKWKSKHM